MRFVGNLFFRTKQACLLCSPSTVKQPIAVGAKSCWRAMSEHLDRTAHNFRQAGISDATVVSVRSASPTVRLLTLKVANPDFNFKAGQWVDFFIPGMEIFTGFSMSSTPSRLQRESTFDLAIQRTDYAPTTWVHTECKVGDKVGVRVGGDQIIYDPSASDPSWDILLIAGGIGINPMYSILQHVRDLELQRKLDSSSYAPGNVEFLYSASCMEELIFKESIEAIASETDNVHCRFFITKEKIAPSDRMSGCRMDEADIATSLQRLDKARLRCFVCGPPPMIADMEKHLQKQGVEPDQIHCEKWW